MKNGIMIGMVLGMTAATVICTSRSDCTFKKAKKAVVKKIEDVLGC